MATPANMAMVSPAPVFGSAVGVVVHCGEFDGKLASEGQGLQATLPTGTPGLHSGVGGAVGETSAGQAGTVTSFPLTVKWRTADALYVSAAA